MSVGVGAQGSQNPAERSRAHPVLPVTLEHLLGAGAMVASKTEPLPSGGQVEAGAGHLQGDYSHGRPLPHPLHLSHVCPEPART